MMRKVNLFLIGNQKSGSTSLAEYIGQHPDICVSTPKATNYFSGKFSKSYKVSNEVDYMKAFGREDSEYLCDASDAYHADFEALKKISKYNPDARILIIIRNPYSMLNSLHQHVSWAGYENISDINLAWSLFESRKNGKDIPKLCPSINYLDYKFNCSVGTQLREVYSIFERQRVCVVFSEQLRENRDLVLKEIFDFLSLSEIPMVKEITSNESVVERSKLLTTINRKTPPRVKMLVKNLALKLGVNLDGKFRVINGVKPAITEEVILSSDINQYLDGEIALLESLLDLNLASWKRNG